MNWFQTAFKRIFCSQEEFNKYTNKGNPTLWEIPPENTEWYSKKEPKKDISEPVYAIAQSMFDRPHTWKVERDDKMFFHPFTHFKVKDIKTGVSFMVTQYHSSYGTRSSLSGLSWITDDEGSYLCNSIETVHKLKLARVERIREVKKSIQRSKVKELYQ